MAKSDFKMKNVDKFMKNLNKEIQELEGRTLAGMIKAVLYLYRQAEPGTPIDTGNLRASWFTVTIEGESDIGIMEFKGDDAGPMRSNHNKVMAAAKTPVKSLSKKRQPVVLFGYTANYAVFVHENVDAKFKRPGAKARWLYAAMQKSRSQMLEIIRQEARF